VAWLRQDLDRLPPWARARACRLTCFKPLDQPNTPEEVAGEVGWTVSKLLAVERGRGAVSDLADPLGSCANRVTTVQSDIAQSKRFLDWLRPGGPWVLTAIPPQGGRTETQTFTNLEAAGKWLETLSGKQNLYFMVNPTRGAVDKKAKKEDVA